MIETELPEVRLLEPRVFRDGRGLFLETYRSDRFAEVGITDTFVQHNHSKSVKHTLRGMHWQWRRPQSKLVLVTEGVIFDAAVDVRRHSPTFGRWVGVELSSDTFQMLYVPAGFAHGFCVLSDTATVQYMCSDVYDPEGEAGLPWNDPVVAIAWPVDQPLLSSRDGCHPPLRSNRTDLL